MTLKEQINREYKDFYTIYRRNLPFIRKMCSYCSGFTNDDIYEIAIYVFFAHNVQSMVDNKVLTNKEIDNRFLQGFRKEVIKDNSYTYSIRTNADLNKVIDRFNIVANEEIEDTDTEDEIVNNVVANELLSKMSGDELEFCLMYVKLGYKHTAKAYKISTSAVRKRFQRYIQKAKENLKEDQRYID